MIKGMDRDMKVTLGVALGLILIFLVVLALSGLNPTVG